MAQISKSWILQIQRNSFPDASTSINEVNIQNEMYSFSFANVSREKILLNLKTKSPVSNETSNSIQQDILHNCNDESMFDFEQENQLTQTEYLGAACYNSRIVLTLNNPKA